MSVRVAVAVTVLAFACRSEAKGDAGSTAMPGANRWESATRALAQECVASGWVNASKKDLACRCVAETAMLLTPTPEQLRTPLIPASPDFLPLNLGAMSCAFAMGHRSQADTAAQRATKIASMKENLGTKPLPAFRGWDLISVDNFLSACEEKSALSRDGTAPRILDYCACYQRAVMTLYRSRSDAEAAESRYDQRQSPSREMYLLAAYRAACRFSARQGSEPLKP